MKYFFATLPLLPIALVLTFVLADSTHARNLSQIQSKLHLVPGQSYYIAEIGQSVKFIGIEQLKNNRYAIIVEAN